VARILRSTLKRINNLFIYSFIHSSMALQPFVVPWPPLQFRNHFYTDGRTPWTSDQPVARQLPTHRTTQTENKQTHRHPWLLIGFEPTIPAVQRTKTFHASDRPAIVIGTQFIISILNYYIHLTSAIWERKCQIKISRAFKKKLSFGEYFFFYQLFKNIVTY
jgi:hypothetical protein